MANDISFEEDVTSYLKRIQLIRNLFTESELRQAMTFEVNIGLRDFPNQKDHKAYSLQEKCFVLISNFYSSKNSESTAISINDIKEIEAITIRQIERIVLFAPAGIFEGKTITSEQLSSVLKNSPKEYQIYLYETRMTESEFDNFIIECSSPDCLYCKNDEELNVFYKRIILLSYFVYSILAEEKKKDWSEEKMMCKLEIAQHLHSERFNLFSKVSSIYSSDDEYNQTILGLSLFARRKYEIEIRKLLEYTYLYGLVYGEDWMRTLLVDIPGELDSLQRLSFVNFLNLSEKKGGSPYVEEFCDAMEKYCYENNIEPAIPLNLVNRRTAKLVRNGSKGEYVRVLSRKLKGVNMDPAKEDRILYGNLKKLYCKLIEEGILDETADEGLFIFRLSGLNKPNELTNNLSVKDSTKLGLVLRCLCSDLLNVFHSKKISKFFITDKCKEPNFSANTKVTPKEMKEPIPKTNFYYVVKLLEDLGFCNVTDVHDGSRS